MFCSKCGSRVDERALWCSRCGEKVGTLGVSPPQNPGDDPVLRIILPVGRSGLAIAAGYAGLFALLILPAPLALVLGVLAALDITRHPEKHGMGRAFFGIATGLVGSLILLSLVAR